MKKVRLGGRVLSVEDELVPRYLAQGYSVIDADGNVIKKGDIVTLDQALVEINRLSAENKKLREENLALSDAIELHKQALAEAVGRADEGGEGKADGEGDNTTPTFACPHCGKTYKTEKGLEAHIEKEHSQE